MQQIQLNVISFIPVQETVTCAFYPEKQKGMAPIHWSKLFDEFPEGREKAKKYYYTDFQSAREGAIEKEIVLAEAVSFACHYFTYLIHQYFKAIPVAVVFPNFVGDVEVWFKKADGNKAKYQEYNRFTLNVQFSGAVYKQFNILVSYNGVSKVLHQPIFNITDLERKVYSRVLHNNVVYHYENNLPDEYKEELENVYPVLNYEITKQYDLWTELKKTNRYPEYLKQQNWLYETYLKTPDFNQLIQLDPNGFFIVPEEKVNIVGKGNNILQFRNGTHINPGLGILTHKPFKAYTEKALKLFFIYNKEDGDFVKGHMYKFMMEGWHGTVNRQEKHSDPLKNYINQPFDFDAAKQTTFENNETIYEEVSQKFDSFHLDPNVTYVALYISPIKKDDRTHPQHDAYYKIKEHLLDKGITSQVIYKEHIDKSEFYYFLPNIYVALLAKMGGVPWLLARKYRKELVIGVGAFKPRDVAERFVGSAFCFQNDGRFEGFKCFRSNETRILAGSIKDAVENYIEQHQSAERIVIHFYKEISDPEELQPILDKLDSIGQGNIPVIIITINKTESREFLGFDLNSPGKMPVSGTYISIGWNKFLLFNNVRYKDDSNLYPKDYHFPIKLSFKTTHPDLLTMGVIGQLIDQVYQFSRMYWKSISQQNMPVTTIYPEMVAEIFPHFNTDKLPEFGEKNLWFL